MLAANTTRTNPWVALLAEGVDRNPVVLRVVVLSRVALLAEGVDRNNPSGGKHLA